jgi:formylglycine-generating enzyme required for sulfatase activity
MYLYLELWKPKSAWLALTAEERKAKIDQLLQAAKQHPITGVVPFSFRQAGTAWIFDGITEQPVIVDEAVARPTGYQFAAAWMVPTRELIDRFEDRVERLGWWFTYFDQQNAWGVMDVTATVGKMLSPPTPPDGKQYEGKSPGEEHNGFGWCPPGHFSMGPPNAKTKVTLTQGFWMGQTAVTQAQYQSVMGENPSGFIGEDLPVDSVGGSAANEFCERLTARERAAGRLPDGWQYCLPTEAQWEYAARAGTETMFPWGDDPKLGDEYAWFMDNAGFMSHPVGQKKPNAWGLKDMMGNCLERCRDAWLPNYPGGTDPEVTPHDVPDRPGESKPFGVSRGSGWFVPLLPVFARIRLGSGDQGYLLGFRAAICRTKASA